MRFLEGKQPRLTHVPPSVRTSVIAAVFPDSAARKAAANAADPEPRITRSNCCAIHSFLCCCLASRLHTPSFSHADVAAKGSNPAPRHRETLQQAPLKSNL